MSSLRLWGLTLCLALSWAMSAHAACTVRPSSQDELGRCISSASGGDAVAALMVGDALADASTRIYDPQNSIVWWEKAAEDGSSVALRRLFDSYWYGRSIARDVGKARLYLDRAAQDGARWARLVQSHLQEAEEPGAAAEHYMALAVEGSCQAQLRLAQGYDRGGWLEKNRSQALYWAIVAGMPGRDPARAESHPLFESRFHYGDCTNESYFLKTELSKALPFDLRAKVEAAAASWRPGRLPERQGPVEVPAALGVAPAGQGAVGSSAAKLPEWRALPTALHRPPGRAKFGAEEVFATVKRSVYVVVAARTDEDFKANRARFGSAVAMDERTLVTNCHVIDEMAVVWLRQGSQMMRATPSGAESGSDRCLLSVSPGRLSAVPGVRPWEDLKVGETVYSIGAPKGLEATLGQGLVSGLRMVKGIRYVQTSAPIAPGSSGGGLFDAAGNLVGITTFHIRDAEGLNFAIAADEYFR